MASMIATIQRYNNESEEPAADEDALLAATALVQQAQQATAKLKSVYGQDADLSSIPALCAGPQAERVSTALGSKVVLRAGSGSELQTKLGQYVDSTNQPDDGAFWPLVQRVSIAGPSAPSADWPHCLH